MLQSDKTIGNQINVQVASGLHNAAGTGGLIPNIQLGGQASIPASWSGTVTYPNPNVLADLSSWIKTSTQLGLASLWRVTVTEEQLVIAIDIPGVRLADLSVIVDRNVLKVSGKRFDNDAIVQQTYVVPQMFDSRSASAVLDSGILTVQFAKDNEPVLHKVSVKGAK